MRLLIGDTNAAAEKLEDAEITALINLERLTGDALPYAAAAACLSALQAKWASAGEGVKVKVVDELRLERGLDQTAAEALDARIRWLRAKAGLLATKRPRGFQSISTRVRP